MRMEMARSILEVSRHPFFLTHKIFIPFQNLFKVYHSLALKETNQQNLNVNLL